MRWWKGAAIRRRASRRANKPPFGSCPLPVWQGVLYTHEQPALPSRVHWWRKASHLTVSGDKPFLSWVMNYASSRGWQLQVAQTGERSSVLARHEGQLMLGFWEGTTLPELVHPIIDAAFRSPPRRLQSVMRC